MTPTELKNLRRDWGLSQRDLAAYVGTRTGRTIRRWEHGEKDIPDSALIILGLLQRDDSLFDVIPEIREQLGILPVSDAVEDTVGN